MSILDELDHPDASPDSPAPDAIASMAVAYAHLQQATIGDSLEHPYLKPISDAYLDAWTGYAELDVLRELLGHAHRLAPLRRSRALVTNFERATAADTDDLVPVPLVWLTASATVR